MLLAWLGVLLPAVLSSARKQEEQLKTQVRALLPAPPATTVADSSRLIFRVAPVTTQGLLSRQVRDALKSLLKSLKRDRIVHLRAFVAGSGDTRRVQTVVSEVFTRKHLPLPSLSVIQVGPLPTPGAQVAIEVVAESKRTRNPNGLAFISGQAVASSEVTLAVAPLVERSLAKVRSAVYSLGLKPKDVLRLTCSCSSLEDGSSVGSKMTAAFPKAAINYVQLRRAYTRAFVSCEALARLKEDPETPLRFLNPKQIPTAGDHSQIALIAPGQVTFSGTQLAFRSLDSDVHLAFDRLGHSLEKQHASLSTVAFTHIYTLSEAITRKVRRLQFHYFDRNDPPASTVVEIEGLPSLDASFAMDVVAVVERRDPSVISKKGN